MSHKFNATLKVAALAIVAAFSTSASAQSANENVISAGWFHIAPQDSSSPLTITSPANFAGTLTGSGASVDTSDTFGVSWVHFFTDNWAGSLDLGVPPTYKLQGTGTLASVGQIGEAKQWAPTVIAKYFFNDANAQFRPFLGLGVSHVSYKDVSLTSDFQTTVAGYLAEKSAGEVVGGATTASLDSKWAPVFNLGGSYAITKEWYASFSVSYLKLKTTADLSTAATTAPAYGGINVGPVLSTTTIKIDPIVTFAAIGYRF
jgi:outer membrane protein